MQKLSLTMLLFLVVAQLHAQLNEGIIIYERKVNMHKRIPLEDERIKNMMAEWNISETRVIFSAVESMFSNIQKEPDVLETAGEERTNRIVLRMGGEENETYKNTAFKK